MQIQQNTQDFLSGISLMMDWGYMPDHAAHSTRNNAQTKRWMKQHGHKKARRQHAKITQMAIETYYLDVAEEARELRLLMEIDWERDDWYSDFLLQEEEREMDWDYQDFSDDFQDDFWDEPYESYELSDPYYSSGRFNPIIEVRQSKLYAIYRGLNELRNRIVLENNFGLES